MSLIEAKNRLICGYKEGELEVKKLGASPQLREVEKRGEQNNG